MNVEETNETLLEDMLQLNKTREDMEEIYDRDEFERKEKLEK